MYNEAEFDLLSQVAKTYLNPSMVLRLQTNTFVEFFGGVDCRKLDEIWERRRTKTGPPCLMFGARWVEQKRWNEWLALTERVHAVKPAVRFLATTQEEKSAD